MRYGFYMSHQGGDTINGVYGHKNNKNVHTPPLLMTISKLITERKWQDLRLFADFRRKKSIFSLNLILGLGLYTFVYK